MSLKIVKAREIVKKFPNTSKRELARLLYKQNKALFMDEENARSAIRRATGSSGKKDRAEVLPTTYQERRPDGIVYNPYELPEQEHNNFLPYVIPVTEETVIGVISDIHFPYQNNEALTVALDHLKRSKITHLVLLGDVMDCYELSTFDRDPAKRSFKHEIDAVRNFLKTLKKKFPGVKIIFKEGNHEYRYVRYLMRKAPEMLGFEVFSLPVLLGLKELDIDHVESSRIIEAGKIILIHGHEFGRMMFSPVNPARGYFTKAKTNVLGADSHQISEHSENTLNGKKLVAYSIGHLADPHPAYRPINNWSHGFAEISFKKQKSDLNFIVKNRKIIDGSVY